MAKALLLEKIAVLKGTAPMTGVGIRLAVAMVIPAANAAPVETVARLNYRSLVLNTISLALGELTVRQMQVVKILLYRLALLALLIQIAPAGTIMLLVVVSRSSQLI